MSTIPKLSENLICELLTPFDDGLLNDEQFGFIRQQTAELNLLTYIDHILRTLETSCEVYSIYADFSKAFERVNHKALIHKLKVMGMEGSLLAWIESYLDGRRQIVRIAKYKSNDIFVIS